MKTFVEIWLLGIVADVEVALGMSVRSMVWESKEKMKTRKKEKRKGARELQK